MLPPATTAQAASVVGICQTLPPQAVLVALTEEVVVDMVDCGSAECGLLWGVEVGFGGTTQVTSLVVEV